MRMIFGQYCKAPIYVDRPATRSNDITGILSENSLLITYTLIILIIHSKTRSTKPYQTIINILHIHSPS